MKTVSHTIDLTMHCLDRVIDGTANLEEIAVLLQVAESDCNRLGLKPSKANIDWAFRKMISDALWAKMVERNQAMFALDSDGKFGYKMISDATI